VTGGGTSPSRRRLFALLGGLAISVVALWLLWRGRAPEDTTRPPAAAEEPAAAATDTPREPPRRAPTPPPTAPYKEEVVTSDGLPIVPPHNDDPRPDGPMHPHPITPQHQRIFAENRIVGNLNGAMDVKDVAGMRRLLEQYRREYPEDEHEMQDGYGVIADCLEHPGATSRAAAERWLPTHNGSTLKRWVNRYCLEPQQ